MVVPVADIKTLIIFFLTFSTRVLAISRLTTAELSSSAGCLAALPLCVRALWIPVVYNVPKFHLWERQVEEPCRVAIHVFDLDLVHAHDGVLSLLQRNRLLTASVPDGLPYYILRWVVINHFSVWLTDH